jgi:hypothetical protein
VWVSDQMNPTTKYGAPRIIASPIHSDTLIRYPRNFRSVVITHTPVRLHALGTRLPWALYTS